MRIFNLFSSESIIFLVYRRTVSHFFTYYHLNPFNYLLSLLFRNFLFFIHMYGAVQGDLDALLLTYQFDLS